MTQAVKAGEYFGHMKNKQKNHQAANTVMTVRSGTGNPEVIEKFYRQIINSFGYAYPTKNAGN